MDPASGVLSQADYGSACEEIERRVLEDVVRRRRPTGTTRRLPRTALALACHLPPAAVLYVVLSFPAALDPPPGKAQASPPRSKKMVDALAAKLEKDPGNLEGWAMLSHQLHGHQPLRPTP